LSGDENKYVLFNAINALANIGNPKAIPVLIKASNNPEHVSRAISALCTFKDDPRVTKVLSDTSMHGPNARVRKKARCKS
jgi:HEAT repeat protein